MKIFRRFLIFFAFFGKTAQKTESFILALLFYMPFAPRLQQKKLRKSSPQQRHRKPVSSEFFQAKLTNERKKTRHKKNCGAKFRLFMGLQTLYSKSAARAIAPTPKAMAESTRRKDTGALPVILPLTPFTYQLYRFLRKEKCPTYTGSSTYL